MLVGGDVPAETSRQTQSLGLGEKRFVTPQLQLRRLALGQVQYEGDAFGWLSVEERRAYQDRNATTVLLHVLCFERPCAAGLGSNSSMRPSSFSSHSAGIRSFQRIGPDVSSSLSYPTIFPKA